MLTTKPFDPNYAARNEWKVDEAHFREIPFSNLPLPEGFQGDGFAYIASLKDESAEKTLSVPSFYSFFHTFDPTQNKLRDLILKIGAKKGCLTTSKRFEVLCRHMNGETKREITKALYPERVAEIDKSEKTIGVEVYVQTLINFYIPNAIKQYAEKHYPHIIAAYFGYFPIHKKFIQRAWMDAIRSGDNPFLSFLSAFDGNPIAILELKKHIQEMSADFRFVEGERFPGFRLLCELAGLYIHLLERRILDVHKVIEYIKSLDDQKLIESVMLIIKLALRKRKILNEKRQRKHSA